MINKIKTISSKNVTVFIVKMIILLYAIIIIFIPLALCAIYIKPLDKDIFIPVILCGGVLSVMFLLLSYNFIVKLDKWENSSISNKPRLL